jgi:cell division protein FtsL
MKKLKKLTIFILIFFALITQVIKIYVSNSAALDSIEASKLEEQVNLLSETNTEIRNEVLSLSSYNLVASKAAALGYKDPRDIISIYDPVKVAVSR